MSEGERARGDPTLKGGKMEMNLEGVETKQHPVHNFVWESVLEVLVYYSYFCVCSLSFSLSSTSCFELIIV